MIWKRNASILPPAILDRVLETGARLTVDVLEFLPTGKHTYGLRRDPDVPTGYKTRRLYRIRVKPHGSVQLKVGDLVRRREDLPGWGRDESRVARIVSLRNSYGSYTLETLDRCYRFTALPWTVVPEQKKD